MSILLTSPEVFAEMKGSDLVEVQCIVCGFSFAQQKRVYLRSTRGHQGHTSTFCSTACLSASKTSKVNVVCLNCSMGIVRVKSAAKTATFCSRSCAASYNNKHKTHGNRRSKLEKWLEEQLTILYPNLEIHFNKKDAIGSELDIYIPSLKLAFESKLDQIRNNDVSKSKLCHEAMIDLCIIDTSGQSYVKPKTSKVFLDIITSIINARYS